MLEKASTIARVLRAVEANGGTIDARALARHLWPNSPLWKKPAKLANAEGHRELGVRLHTAAGCLAGRLVTAGYLRKFGKGRYGMSDRGRAFISPPPALPPPAPSSASAAPVATTAWRHGWVFFADGVWRRALIGLPIQLGTAGIGFPAHIEDGRQIIAPAASVYLG